MTGIGKSRHSLLVIRNSLPAASANHPQAAIAGIWAKQSAIDPKQTSDL